MQQVEQEGSRGEEVTMQSRLFYHLTNPNQSAGKGLPADVAFSCVSVCFEVFFLFLSQQPEFPTLPSC